MIQRQEFYQQVAHYDKHQKKLEKKLARVRKALQAEQSLRSNEVSKLHADLGLVREQQMQSETLLKQQKLQLNLQQSETNHALLQSKAAAAELRRALELEQAEKRQLQSLLDTEHAENRQAQQTGEKTQIELGKLQVTNAKLKRDLAAKERDMEKLMSVSETQLNELRGRQSLDEVRDSHLRVVAEKDKQLAELTTVLKRQTEELKKHRLSGDDTVNKVEAAAPSPSPALLHTHTRWLSSMSKQHGKLITHGDFWRLSDSRGENSWAAWQYHLGPEDAGVAYFFRRSNDSQRHLELGLRSINPDLDYLVEIFRTCDLLHSEQMKGSELIRHSVTIEQAPGSLLVQYSTINSNVPRDIRLEQVQEIVGLPMTL